MYIHTASFSSSLPVSSIALLFLFLVKLCHMYTFFHACVCCRYWASIKQIINTFTQLFTLSASLMALVILFLFMYTIVGYRLFGNRYACTCTILCIHWLTSIFTSRPVCDIWLFAAKGSSCGSLILIIHVHVHVRIYMYIHNVYALLKCASLSFTHLYILLC